MGLLALSAACENAPSPTPASTPTATRVTADATPSVGATAAPTTAPTSPSTPAPSATPTSAAAPLTPQAKGTQGALLDPIDTPSGVATPFPPPTKRATVGATTAPTSTPPLPTPFPTSAPYVRRLLAAPGNPSPLFALTSANRLVRSDDGGAAWSEIATASTGATALTGIGIDYRNPKTLYLTTDKGIFRSDDQGRTWTFLNSLLGQGITVDFNDPKILWTGVSSGRNLEIRKSLDGGAMWNNATTGFFGHVLAGPILIDPQDSNTLYAVADGIRGGQTLYRGTRDGAWKGVSLPSNFSFGYCCFVPVGVAWSTNSRTLYIGSGGGRLYGSANAKEPDVTKVNWRVVADFGADKIVGVLAHGEPNETLYVTLYDTKANQSKLLKSPDGGQSWQELPMP